MNTGDQSHIPVLLEPVMSFVRSLETKPQSFLDGTFGRGGHTRAILEHFPSLETWAVDLDSEALEYGRSEFSGQNIHFIHANFKDVLKPEESELKSVALERNFDLILFDLGVSSPQLDRAERGFSFYHSGPLDMRMDKSQELSAGVIVNEWGEEELLEIFRDLGEIRRPQRVVRAILDQRGTSPLRSTQELSELIERVEGWRKKGHHPATRYFLALRLEVNRELEGLGEALEWWIQRLSEGGRMLVISFHSLEDRIVKFCFRANKDLGQILTKKVVQAERDEQLQNPRARSAKLRVFQKGGPQ